MKRLRGADGERGASLILVLVLVMSFGLIVPALLTSTQTSVSSVSFTRDVVKASANAEAAADRAINELRRGTFYNEPSQRCFHDPADTLGVNDTDVRSYAGLTAAGETKVRPTLVACQAADDSGFPTSIRVPITDLNRPGQALLTLGRNSERGLRQSGNNTLRIAGRVYSNSTIQVENSNARLEVDNAALIARGDCIGPGTLYGTPKSCNDTTQDALGVDPGYALPPAPPAFATAPNCSKADAFTLFPGTYTSAAALSKLTKHCGALLHFTAGTYYFDFPDADPVWDVSDGYVIGGAIPTGSRAWSKSAYPGVKPTVPGACVAPTESTTNGGVTFIFGGASRMRISGGAKVEICAQFDMARPPIAVFGANSGSGSGPVTRVVTVSSASTTSSPKFENLGRIAVKDGATSDALLIGVSSKDRATITATLPSSPVPANAVLVDARLRIAHRDQVGPATTVSGKSYPAGPITSLAATLTPEKPTGGATPPVLTSPDPLVVRADLATDPVREDTLDFTSELKPYFDAYGFAGAKASFTAVGEPDKAATTMVDSIILEVTYQVPGFRAQNNCVAAVPYTNGSSGPCALISADGSNPETRVYMEGMTYAPLAAIDVTLNNVSEQVFTFGVVARTVRVALTGSMSYTGAIFAVPDIRPAFAATVPLAAHLQVYVCETGTCASPGVVSGAWVPPSGSGWVRRLSTQVRVTDAVYPPTPDSRQIGIVHWFHPR